MVNNSVWTHRAVADRVAEAATTLRRLRVTGLKPKGYGSTWPDVIYTTIDVSDWLDVQLRVGPPLPDEISRMDEVFCWLRLLAKDELTLVWMMAENVPRKIICAKVGMTRNKAWKAWVAALMTIASHLNHKQKKLVAQNSLEDRFHAEHRRTGNASAAYRSIYQCEGLSNAAVHARASRLARKGGMSVPHRRNEQTLTETRKINVNS